MSAAAAKYRVLLVTDDQQTCRGVRDILEAAAADGSGPATGYDFELAVAEQGWAARGLVEEAQARNQPFVAVFVDQRLSGKWDGMETARRLRDLDTCCLSVVLLADAGVPPRGLDRDLDRTGRFLFLQRPFCPLEVQQLAYVLAEKYRLCAEHLRRETLLEQRVRERTAELEAANEHLRREIIGRRDLEVSLQQARRLEALGRLAGGVGHEINNPLTVVTANLGFLEEALDVPNQDWEPELAQDVTELLAAIHRGTDRITKVVSEMMVLSSPGEDRPSVVNISECLSMSVRMVQGELASRARVTLDLDDDIEVWGERGRIQQVFVSLLLNAAQAMPEGQEERHEVVAEARASEGMATVIIRDTGCGIPDGDRERVFEPFYTTKGPGPRGLGLSVSLNIVTALGGTIALERQKVGTAVRVELPLHAGAPALAAADAKAVLGEIASTELRVLVVDDEPDVLGVFERLLRDYQVTLAGGGIEALEACRKADFDLVLCDLVMNDLSGMELYRELLRERPDLASRFVPMTGGAVSESSQEFLHSFEHHLLKPASREQVLRIVRAAARKAHARPRKG